MLKWILRVKRAAQLWIFCVFLGAWVTLFFVRDRDTNEPRWWIFIAWVVCSAVGTVLLYFLVTKRFDAWVSNDLEQMAKAENNP